jgi:hypothetical protein
MDPDHVGRGGLQRWPRSAGPRDAPLPWPAASRVIRAWNILSLRFSQGLGFVDVGDPITVRGGREVEYRVLVKQPCPGVPPLARSPHQVFRVQDQHALIE